MMFQEESVFPLAAEFRLAEYTGTICQEIMGEGCRSS
jgi:hypothetical protein